ncbi:hypothetical protein SCHPADRAFT_831280 [Schizopora paradoxa]|uniref:F-box domain-containing protein n=1 Tax=Schizopora paradoxa TaxID=27342 RepID=A0A0H2S2U7_9AGAM|nr:hypothetical protein SCHPADRAFT_831280 [Schizopora paradoxa]
MLLAIPWDICHRICSWLPLGSVVSLRQTCSQINQSVSDDKQLWLNLIARYVLCHSINLHPLRTKLEDASAKHVESWLRCAIYSQRVFSSELKPNIFRVKLNLHVTWLKIIRIRWCLVASSSPNESRLTIWNLDGTPSISKEYFISGPVVDGLVDDDGSQIIAALTIGAT